MEMEDLKRSLVVGLNSSTMLRSFGKLLSYVISAKEETEEDSQGRPSVTSSQVWLWDSGREVGGFQLFLTQREQVGSV